MIIVSQDKTELINFDNVVRLTVSVNTSRQFLIEAHNFCDDFETVIGLYKTEERAKEVFEEIIEEYEHCNSSYGNQGYVKNKTYYMPEE